LYSNTNSNQNGLSPWDLTPAGNSPLMSSMHRDEIFHDYTDATTIIFTPLEKTLASGSEDIPKLETNNLSRNISILQKSTNYQT
jgi:hypothetical protein